MQLHHRRHHQHRWRTSSGGAEHVRGAFEAFAGRLAAGARGHSGFHAQGETGPVSLTSGNSNNNERLGRNTMGLAIATTSFECTIDGGLAHIVLNQPDRGNPIDGDFCREFGLCMAELSERDDVRSVLISARGRLFSVGGDLMSLVKQGDALPGTIKAWTADIHVAIARMVRMRAPVVAAVHANVAGGSVSLMAA